jgi:DNA-binding transcriptional ArsR family regulator
MAPDLLSTICREIDERLSELRPQLAEYKQLLVAADALVPTSAATAAQAVPKTVPGMPEKVTRAKSRRARPVKALELAPAAPAKLKPAKPKPPRAERGAAREAILAALDHGSHTVGELAVVTAMSAPNINGNLRRLAAEGAVVKTEREGKTAYALANA